MQLKVKTNLILFLENISVSALSLLLQDWLLVTNLNNYYLYYRFVVFRNLVYVGTCKASRFDSNWTIPG